MIDPPVNRSKPPNFHEMPSEAFEALTCALLESEPGTRRTDLFGVQRQKQYGIDAFGKVADGEIVASCKCYKKISKDDFAAWSNDFLNHWESHWKARKVKKFILAVSVPAHSVERLKDIEREEERFRQIGVEYEVWSPRQLQEKLRPHRGIVSQFLGEAYVSILCGTAETLKQIVSSADVNRTDLQLRLEALTQAASDQFRATLDDCKRHLARGDVHEVERILNGARTGGFWAGIDCTLQADALRLLGSAAINQGDIDAAERLSDEADQLSAPESPRLRALIALNRTGAAKALEVLGVPTIANAWELKVGLHFVAGELDEGDKALLHLEAESAEAMRLKAYGALLRGNVLDADRFIRAAIAKEPDSLAIKRISAMVTYSRALSPKAPAFAMSQPQPVDWLLVQRNDNAHALFLEAYQAFDAIRKRSLHRGIVEVEDAWCLASLCNLGRMTDAEQEAKALLQRDPINAFVIGWIVSKGLKVDLEPSRAALVAALEAGTMDVNGPRSLEWLTPEAERALLEVAVTRRLGDGEYQGDVRLELEELRDRLQGIAPADDSVLALLNGDGSPDQIEAAFNKLAAEIPVQAIFTSVAISLASENRWRPIVEHAELLLSFQTADLSRMVALAAFNAEDYPLTRKVLSERVTDFAGGLLPYELRVLDAETSLKLGDVAQALRVAAAISGTAPSHGVRLWQADLKAKLGDIRSARPAVKEALDAGKLAPDTALHWSRQLVIEEKDLARDLWRYAVAGKLTDELALFAWHLGASLGTSAEKPELFAAVTRLAEVGDSHVWKVSVDELPDLITNWHKDTAANYDAWLKGDLPVHLAVHATGANLGQLYHFDRGPKLRAVPILTRSAARHEVFFQPPFKPDVGYVLDITALMCAHQCGLLRWLISRGRSLYIGHNTIPAILEFEHDLITTGEADLSGWEKVVSAIGRGVSLVSPPDALRVTPKPEHLEGAVGIEAVLKVLVDSGRLVRRLDQLREKEPSASPELGQALEFCDHTLVELASQDALPAAIEAFAISIDEAALADGLDALENVEADRGTAAWLRSLRTFISHGLEEGTIRLLDKSRLANTDSVEDEIQTSAALNLLEVLRSGEGRDNCVVWIDDRQVTGYNSTGSGPLTTTYDVLVDLHGSAQLDETSFFEMVMALRRGGTAFIPITAAELSYHLAHAPVHDGVLVETAELAGLRRNLSLQILHMGYLRVGPDGINGKPNELPYMLAVRRFVQDAIVDCWSSSLPTRSVRPRADWLWDAFRADLYFREDTEPTVSPALTISAMTVAGLMSASLRIKLDGPLKAKNQRRIELLQWINEVVVGQRFEIDPDFRSEVARLTRELLSPDRILDKNIGPHEKEAFRRMARIVVSQSPPRIRDLLLEDRRFAWRIGMPAGQIVKINGKDFWSARFFRAMHNAVNYGRGRVRAVRGKGRATLTFLPEQQKIRFGGCLKGLVFDGDFLLLSKSEAVFTKGVNLAFADLDLLDSERADCQKKLTAIKAPVERIGYLEGLREKSLPLWKQKLIARAARRENFGIDAFEPPSFELWLKYIRWDGDVSRTLERLKREFSPADALERVGGWPVDLGLLALSDIDMTQLGLQTPLAWIHILRSAATSISAAPEQLTEYIGQCVEALNVDGYLFCILARWSALHFERQKGWATLDPNAKHLVVWTCADTLTQIIQQSSVEPKSVADFFAEHMPAITVDRRLDMQRGYDDSPAITFPLSTQGLALAGLEYAIGNLDHSHLPPETSVNVFNVCSVMLEAGQRIFPPLPSFGWLEDGLDTWMKRPQAGCLFDGEDVTGQWLTSTAETFERNPANVEAMQALFAMSRPVFSEPMRKTVAAGLERSDLGRLAGQSSPLGNVLRQWADLAVRIGDAEAEGCLRKLLLHGRVAFRGPLDAHMREELQEFVEALAGCSKSWEKDGLATFAANVSQLLQLNPSVAPAMTPILQNMHDATPVGASKAMWLAYLKSRSLH